MQENHHTKVVNPTIFQVGNLGTSHTLKRGLLQKNMLWFKNRKEIKPVKTPADVFPALLDKRRYKRTDFLSKNRLNRQKKSIEIGKKCSRRERREIVGINLISVEKSVQNSEMNIWLC